MENLKDSIIEKLNDLTIDFEETEVELKLLTETFEALDEGFENGANYHPKALALPTIMLKKISDRLAEINNDMFSALRKYEW